MAANYFEIFTHIWETFSVQWKYNGPTDTFLQDFKEDLCKYGRITLDDIVVTLLLGVAFTFARFATTAFVFKPLANHFQFIAKDKIKFPESAWKLLYYFSSYSYCCYLLYNGKYSFIEDPDSVWEELKDVKNNLEMKIPGDIYILYVVQTSFYLHSIYGTVFMDKWRKDSIVMILHHVLTISLLVFSFAVRYHNVGLIVLYLHDIADVFLEFTKICVCFKSWPGLYKIIADKLVTSGFLVFAFVWAKCRLYQYPYRVLYVTGYSSMQIVPEGKFYLSFNVMLWMLFLMNIWWFHFVLWLIWRVLNGESREVEDIRELSKEDKSLTMKRNMVKNGKPPSNSYHSHSEEQNEKEEKNGINKHSEFPHQRRKKNLQGN